MGASGLREMTKREMDAPKVNRSAMLGRIAGEGSSLQGTGREGQREEELAKPKVRDDKEGFARYHAPEIRVMKGNGSENGPKFLSSRLDASRNIPVAREVGVRDYALADTKVASTTEGVTKSSIAGPEGSKRRPMSFNNRAKIMSKPSKGPEG